eukprot:365938-Chlamydomonas_euryale.AAC.6
MHAHACQLDARSQARPAGPDGLRFFRVGELSGSCIHAHALRGGLLCHFTSARTAGQGALLNMSISDAAWPHTGQLRSRPNKPLRSIKHGSQWPRACIGRWAVIASRKPL